MDFVCDLQIQVEAIGEPHTATIGHLELNRNLSFFRLTQFFRKTFDFTAGARFGALYIHGLNEVQAVFWVVWFHTDARVFGDLKD